MKSFKVLLLFLLVCVNLYAQDFKLLDSTKVQFYTDSKSNIYAISLDSALYSSQTNITTYFNYKLKSDDLSQPPFGTVICDDTLNYISWLGDHISFKDNYVFKNNLNQNIIIRTDSNALPWKIIELDSSKYIVGSINKVLSNDSVLVINMEGVSTIIDPIFNIISLNKIIISKKNGFERIFDFRKFPIEYVPMQFHSSFGKDKVDENIGIKAFMNYSVGDIIQYKAYRMINESHGKFHEDTTYISLEILVKDGVKYKVRRRQFKKRNDTFVITYSYNVDVVNYSFYFPPGNNLPNDRYIGVKEFSWQNIIEINKFYSDTSHSLIKKEFATDCSSLTFWPYYERKYQKGVGFISSVNQYQNNHTTDTLLIYLKKDNIEWGDSINFKQLIDLYLGVLNNNFYNKSLNIFPNPSSNFINILSSDMFEKITVLNVDGRVVLELDNVNDNIINIEELPMGIYMLKANDPNGRIYSARFIKN